MNSADRMKKSIFNSKSVMIFLVLFLILLTPVFARPVFDAAFDSVRGGLTQISNFFAGQQYQPYAKAIDFFFFALLFIAVYMMGARYAFKEVKRPEQVIVILLGLMTAFLLVLADISAVMLLPFIHWIFYVLLFMLYWWLLKGIKNPFWRFLLALLLTLLTIGLFQGLFNALRAPEIGTISAPGVPSVGGFGFGNFFKDWGNNFGTLGIPQFTTPGFGGLGDWANKFGSIGSTQIPSLKETPTGPDKTPPKETTPAAPGETPPKDEGTSMWSWLLPLLLLLALLGGGFALWKRRGSGERQGTPWWRRWFRRRQREPEEQLTIERILEELKRYFKIKYEFLVKLYDIYKRKKKLKDKIDEYHKKLYGIIHGLHKDEDISLLLDPDHRLHQEYLSSGTDVDELIKREIELHDYLKELLRIEYELSGYKGKSPIWKLDEQNNPIKIKGWEKGKIQKWKEVIEGIFINPPDEPGFLKLQSAEYQKYAAKLQEYLNNLPNVTNNAKIAVQQYYAITGARIKADRELKELLNPAELEKWIKKSAKERWVALVQMKDRESNDPEAYRKITEFLTNPQYNPTTGKYYIKEDREKLKRVFARDLSGSQWDTKDTPYLLRDISQEDNEPYFLRAILFRNLNLEKNHLKYIYWLTKLLNDLDLKTIIQALRVNKKVDEKGELKWVEATEEARTKGVAFGTPLQIYTRVAQGKPQFTAHCFIYKKTGTAWKLKWYTVKIGKITLPINIRYPKKEAQYNEYVAPGEPPAIPSKNDFNLPDGSFDEAGFTRAEDEYYQKLFQYNQELAQKSQTIQQVVGEVIFSSDDPEKGFGDLEPGEYKFIVMTRGRRDYTNDEGKEDLYPPEVIQKSATNDFGAEIQKYSEIRRTSGDYYLPSAIKRYGWDSKEAVVIIKGGKETETVLSGSKIVKVNGNEITQEKTVKIDKTIGLKSVESLIKETEAKNYRYIFYRVYSYKKWTLRKEKAGKIEYESLVMPLTDGTIDGNNDTHHLLNDIDKKLEEGTYRLIGYLTRDTAKKSIKPFDSVKLQVGQLLNVNIIRPSEKPIPTLTTGENIELEAEVVGEDKMLEELAKDINEERGYSFEWYIEQKGAGEVRINLGPVGGIGRKKGQAIIHVGRRTNVGVPEYTGDEPLTDQLTGEQIDSGKVLVLQSYGTIPFVDKILKNNKTAKLIVKVIRNDEQGKKPVELLTHSIDVKLLIGKTPEEKLTVTITEPLRDTIPTLYTGNYLSLEAEVKGENDAVTELSERVNKGQGFSFEWFIEQKRKWIPLPIFKKRENVHEGRVTEFIAPVFIGEKRQIKIHSDRFVSENFREGKARLMVVVKKDKKAITKPDYMDVIIKKSKLEVEIIKPQKDPMPNLYLGAPVLLEAEVKGDKGGLNELANQVNKENGYTFEWHLKQKGRWWRLGIRKSQLLHTGRKADFDAPLTFDEANWTPPEEELTPEQQENPWDNERTLIVRDESTLDLLQDLEEGDILEVDKPGILGKAGKVVIHSMNEVSGKFNEGNAMLLVAVKKEKKTIANAFVEVNLKRVLSPEDIIVEELSLLGRIRKVVKSKTLDKASYEITDLLHKFEKKRLDKTVYSDENWRKLNVKIADFSRELRIHLRGIFLHEAKQLEFLERIRAKLSEETQQEDETKSGISVNIIRPASTPTPELAKGTTIDLEAEVTGDETVVEDVINDINKEKGYRFEWYLEQETRKLFAEGFRLFPRVPLKFKFKNEKWSAPMHIGRRTGVSVPEYTKNMIVRLWSHEEVPEYFKNGPAKLVAVVKKMENIMQEDGTMTTTETEVARNSIDVIIKPKSKTAGKPEEGIPGQITDEELISKLQELFRQARPVLAQLRTEARNEVADEQEKLNALALDVQAGAYDIISMLRILEHIENPGIYTYAISLSDTQMRRFGNLTFWVLYPKYETEIENKELRNLFFGFGRIVYYGVYYRMKVADYYLRKRRSFAERAREFYNKAINLIDEALASSYRLSQIFGEQLTQGLGLLEKDEKSEEEPKPLTDQIESELSQKLTELYRKFRVIDTQIQEEIENTREPKDSNEALLMKRVIYEIDELRDSLRERSPDLVTGIEILRNIDDQDKVLELVRNRVARSKKSFWAGYEEYLEDTRSRGFTLSNKEINLRILNSRYNEFNYWTESAEEILKLIEELYEVEPTPEVKAAKASLWKRLRKAIKDLREKRYTPSMRINLLRLEGTVLRTRQELPPEDKKDKVEAESLENEIEETEIKIADDGEETPEVQEKHSRDYSSLLERASSFFDSLRSKGNSALNQIADEFTITGKRLMKLTPSLAQVQLNLADKNILQPAEFVQSPVPPKVRQGGFTVSNVGGRVSQRNKFTGGKKGSLARASGKGMVNYRTPVQKRANQSYRRIAGRR